MTAGHKVAAFITTSPQARPGGSFREVTMNQPGTCVITQEEDPIAESIRASLARYFEDLDGEAPCALYDMVLARVEKPLLELVLVHVAGNQTRAAEVLGINRNTLRKKLQTYDML